MFFVSEWKTHLGLERGKRRGERGTHFPLRFLLFEGGGCLVGFDKIIDETSLPPASDAVRVQQSTDELAHYVAHHTFEHHFLFLPSSSLTTTTTPSNEQHGDEGK